jgi:AraC family transcriptional regulator
MFARMPMHEPYQSTARVFREITFGQLVKRFDQDGFVLTKAVYAPSTVLAPHAHEFANVSIVRHGSFVEMLRGRSQECVPFSAIAKPAAEIHSDRFGPLGAVCFHISFTPQRAEEARRFSRIFEAPMVQGGLLPILTLKIEEELRALDSASALAIEGLVFELLAHLVRLGDSDSSGRLPRWLGRAKDLIHGMYPEGLSLCSIAEHVGVHPAHLARTFRKHYRCSVGEYLRRVRIETAIQLLQNAESSIAEVGCSVGFYDQSHFTHAFKKHTGVTPAHFRADWARNARTKSILFSKKSGIPTR